MHLILLLCAVSIALHKGALLWAMTRKGLQPHDRLSFISAALMLAASFAAMFSFQWYILIVAYSTYRLCVGFQIIAGPHKAQRQTILIPVNFSMSIFSVLALVAGQWIFPLTYLFYWIATWQITRRRLQRIV